jgi:alpha-D-xyloside xylohydrolase
MHTKAVYEGQRKETSDKRVFILTRSAWAGQQRNSAVSWSGDIAADWNVYRNQIPAGLNFVSSGIPYWNTDIGGFFGNDTNNPAFCELFIRWFQYGAFCPMFRVHGTGTPKEIYRFKPELQAIEKKFIELRYRLMPYIYSTAWQVTNANDSLMRPLVFDFVSDTKVYDIKDQFLFGRSLLINPVTNPGTNTRPAYLPAKTTWYDFWTGERLAGGQTITASAPLSSIPIYVRAGSILPLSPITNTTQVVDDPIELRIYRGADGKFTLYEDEGNNYNYEHGAYSTIPITWSEKTQKLTIGARRGSFKGMPAKHTFHIVWADKGHGTGVEVTNPDVTVEYAGEVKTVSPRKTRLMYGK